MSKKDSMLQCIMNNAEWLMTTSTAVEVIPYYELSYDTFSRAKQYFAKSAEYEDVICLISTSVIQLGKSGILFTTDYVYSKAWGGILTGSYRNSIYSPYEAEFDVINEFDTERMRTLMSALAGIAQEDDQKQQLQDTLKTIGNTIGKVALGSMVLADIISNMQDCMVDQNNDEIAKQLAQLEDSDSELSVIIQAYGGFETYIQEFMELIVSNNSEKTGKIINILNDILLLLHSQVKENIDLSLENEENYFKYIVWIEFWALLFGDEEQFKQKYDNEMFESAPEAWRNVIWMLDLLLSDWNPGFMNIIDNFANTILTNTEKISELMENEDFDEESIDEIIKSNNENVEILYNALDKATEDISIILSEM